MSFRNKPLTLAIANALLVTGAASHAAVIEVTSPTDTVADDGVCTLPEAIENGNNNSQNGRTAAGECAAGDGGAGSDIIRFSSAAQTITLTSALPTVTDYLQFEGAPTTIERSGGCNLNGTAEAGEFRLLTVDGFGITASDLTFQNGCADGPGQARHGGAIALYSGTTSLANVQFRDNQANGLGGAIYATGAGTSLGVSESGFYGNSTYRGGGLAVSNAQALYLFRSTFSDNTATRGGGVSVFGVGTARIDTNTFSGNTATAIRGGGAIYAGTPFDLRHSTLVDNLGGGADSQIEAGETSGAVTASLFVGGGADNCGLSGSVTVDALSQSTDASCGGATVVDRSDLVLSPLADNGGSTQTHALGLGSTAIDAGGSACFFVDQRGVGRPFGAACDVGAFEADEAPQSGLAFIVNATDDAGDGICGDAVGECTLRDAVIAANSDPDASVIAFNPAVFANPVTITLAQGEIVADESLTITGPGASLLTVDANNQSRHFQLADISDPNTALGTTNAFSGMTLANGNGANTGGGNTGGAIRTLADLTLEQMVIRDNSARNGGGVWSRLADMAITSSTLSGNSVINSGGAAYAREGALTIVSSTISGNAVAVSGAGAGVHSQSGSLYVRDSTLDGNTGPAGQGGIYARSVAVIERSIVANSGGYDLNGISGFGLIYSLVEDEGTVTISENVNSILGVDPNLGALTDNGGPTPTQTLLYQSPAIDAGGTVCAGFDQRGESRPFDGDGSGAAQCDIGAVEVQRVPEDLQVGPDFVVNATDDAGDGDCGTLTGECTLRDALLATNADVNASEVTFDSVVFAASQTITIIGSQLPISTPATITGPGQTLLAISGGNAVALLEIDDGDNAVDSPVTISGLILRDGNSTFVPSIDVDESLTLNEVTVTANTATSASVFDFFDRTGNQSLRLGGVTLTNNLASDTARGGVDVDLRGGSVSVAYSTFSGNTVTRGGSVNSGALNINADGGSVSISNSTLSNNRSDGTNVDSGGGLDMELGNGAQAVIFESNFTGNYTGSLGGTFERSRGQGGGIYAEVETGSNLRIENSTVSGNTAGGEGSAQKGGGLYLYISADSSVVIEDSEISGNTTGLDGGGLYLAESYGALTIERTQISNNEAGADGGGLWATDGGSLIIRESIVSGNTSNGPGGGLYLYAGDTSIENSLIGGNESSLGGGIYSRYGTLSITNSTISDNSATSFGGGLTVYGGIATESVAIVDSTIADNRASSGPQFSAGETSRTISVTRSVLTGLGSACSGGGLITTSADSLASDSSCGPVTASYAAAINLGPLADNGGSTQTHLPLPGSVLIDAAPGCAGVDQRGLARAVDADGIVGNECDIGAVEVQNTPVMATNDTATTDEDTPINGTGLLDNDIDADDEDAALTVTAVDGSAVNVGVTVTIDNVSFVINQDGSYSAAPTLGLNGLDTGGSAQASIDFTVSDGIAESAAQLSITVDGLNDPPFTENTAANTTEGVPVTGFFNGFDPDIGEVLNFGIISEPQAGEVTLLDAATGEFQFDPSFVFNDLNAGESRQVTFNFTVSDEAATSVSTLVTITVNGVDGGDAADLQIDKTDGVDVVQLNDMLTYTISVLNDGPFDVVGARVQDLLPSSLGNASWSCETVTKLGNCGTLSGTGDIDALVDIPAGDSVVFTLMATVADDTDPVVNTATVEAPVATPDPIPGNNSSTDINGVDLLVEDSFESPAPLLKSFADRQAIVSRDQVSQLLLNVDGQTPQLLVHAQNRAVGELDLALVHARRINRELQLRVSRLEDGQWDIGAWDTVTDDLVELSW